MSTRKISLTATLFLFIYILQEAFITQLRIAGGGSRSFSFSHFCGLLSPRQIWGH